MLVQPGIRPSWSTRSVNVLIKCIVMQPNAVYTWRKREKKSVQNYPEAIVGKLIRLSSAVMVYPWG